MKWYNTLQHYVFLGFIISLQSYISNYILSTQCILVPSLSTKTKSLSMTVGILCATVMTVHPLVSSLIVFWIKLSVAVSMDAVASSKTKIFLFFSSSLARQTSCLCPTLQFSPFSATAQVFVHIKRVYHINSRFFKEKNKNKTNCGVEAFMQLYSWKIKLA